MDEELFIVIVRGEGVLAGGRGNLSEMRVKEGIGESFGGLQTLCREPKWLKSAQHAQEPGLPLHPPPRCNALLTLPPYYVRFKANANWPKPPVSISSKPEK